MTVNIDIDLNARSAFVKLGGLKAQIEALSDDLDLDLDLDGDLGDTLDNLTDTVEDIFETFDSDLNETIDRLENLDVDLGGAPVEGGGDSGGGTGSDSGDGNADRSALYRWLNKDSREVIGRMGGLERDRYRIRDNLRGVGDNGGFITSGRMGNVRESLSMAGSDGSILRSSTADKSFLSGMGDFASDSGARRFGGGLKSGLLSSHDPGSGESFGDKMAKARRAIDSMKKSMKNAIPSMNTWFNLIAAAIPALGALIVQALGVASAFGAIALAGAGMVGLGLIGHGDSMAESFRNAGEEVDQLKKDLFETFQPSAQLFSGIQAEFFDFMPGELDRVSESMRNLLPLKGEFFEMFTQITKFISQFFKSIGQNSGLISELWDNFKGIIGSGIISLFEWLMKTTQENQPMLIKLGQAFKILALTLYDIFLVVSRAIIVLTSFLGILRWVGKFLNNKFTSWLLAGVIAIYAMITAFTLLTGSLGAVATALGTGLIPLFSGIFSTLSAYIFQTIAATVANYGLAASIANVAAALGTLMAMSGIGLLVAGGGIALGKSMGLTDGFGGGGGIGSSAPTDFSGGGSSNGTTNNYYEGDNVNVDLSGGDTASYEKFADMQSGRDRGAVDGSYTA